MLYPIQNAMNLKLKLAGIVLPLLALSLEPSIAPAQSTAWTYQGRLNSGGTPATGLYDFRFKLAADPLGNHSMTGYIFTNAFPVTNGLFTAVLDFGAGVFTGSNCWLDIEVRTNNLANTLDYTALTPLQSLTPTPYALFATTASNVSGTISSPNISGTYGNAVTLSNAANSFTGSFSGNGANVANVNAATLNGLNSSSLWLLGGNTLAAVQFLGSLNDQPVEFWVNNGRALRLEPGGSHQGAPNVIGGSLGNTVASGVSGATISGGGATNYNGGGNGYNFTNSVASGFSSIGGGKGNLIQANTDNSTIPGGVLNQIQSYAYAATIGGGYSNQVLAGASADLSAESATIGGGEFNRIQGSAHGATIPGGANNIAGGPYAFAAGQQAHALHQGAFVWADSENAAFSSTANDQFLIRAQGGVGIIGSLGLGTTSPGQPLDVQNGQAAARFTTTNSSNGSVIELKNTTAAGATLGAINFNNAGNGYPGQIAYSSGNTMSFRVAGNNNAMQLTSSSLTVNGTVVSSSDRNMKQDFQAVDSRSVLEKVSQLPVQTWAYQNDPGTKHLGPMAQDFYAAFGTGADDRHIAVVDEGGVALAAIQGLNQKLEEIRAESKAKDAEIKALQQSVVELKKLVESFAQSK